MDGQFDEFLRNHMPKGGEKYWTQEDMKFAFEAGYDKGYEDGKEVGETGGTY